MATSPLQTVWLIEDNLPLSRTVARAVDAVTGFRCVAQYQRCEDALAALRLHPHHAPGIILLDVGLPGMSGLEGISLIKTTAPQTQVIVLTVFEDDEKIYEAICAGASRYLLKSAPLDEIAGAIAHVSRGGSSMTPKVARRVLEMFSRIAPKVPSSARLSPREKQIVEGMAEGLTNKEIAARLGLSAHTTDDYTRVIYEKLHVNSRSGAVAKAVRERLI